MQFFEEELLEPIARYFRFQEGVTEIQKIQPITIADLGCGPLIRFYGFLRKKKYLVNHYYGIDPLLKFEVIKSYRHIPEISLIKKPLDTSIPLENEVVDYVVGFAFLEHIQYPEKIVHDAVRVLKKGGKAIFTVPSPKAKRILEFLSFNLGLISRREIEEHKQYFDKDLLTSLVDSKKNITLSHHYFEWGMNNIFVLVRS